MSLNANNLKSTLVTEIKNIPGIIILNDPELDRFCLAVATAVVNHITANAVVNTTVSVTVPGVQTGLSTLPGSGTGVGTVS